MQPIFSESGRTARVVARCYERLMTIALTEAALEFSVRFLGITSKTLLRIPIPELVAIRRVNERGIASFEVSQEGHRNICWFDTTKPAEWEQAFRSLGIAVLEPDVVASNELSGGE
jgi:hypothetical protein